MEATLRSPSTAADHEVRCVHKSQTFGQVVQRQTGSVERIGESPQNIRYIILFGESMMTGNAKVGTADRLVILELRRTSAIVSML